MNIENSTITKITAYIIALFVLVHFNIFAAYSYSINNYLSYSYSHILLKQISAETLLVPSSNTNNLTEDKLNVMTSFYPIYEFVKGVGSNNVDVETLIPIGLEPHDFEPTVQQIQKAENADLIIYNGGGFEGQWINGINNENKLNLIDSMNLTAEDNGLVDQHIWLDPILVKEQVNIIRDELIRIDPANINSYEQNTQNFISELDSLDSYIRQSLSTCEKKDFISFHDAFSYFANRYNLTAHSISETMAPEGEVLPQRIPEIVQLAQRLGINTIYAEEMIDPRAAQVIAQEIPGGNVLILSPIEGITEEEQSKDIGYMEKMSQNVDNLKVGLQCPT